MAINSVQDMMLDSLLKASRAAEQITPAVDRCKAYTELAKACAAAIETKGSTEIPKTEEPKEVPKTAKRGSKKATQLPDPKTELPKLEEPKVEEPAVEVPTAEQSVVEEVVPEEVQSENADIIEPDITEEKTPEQLEEEEYDFTTEWTPKACELMEKEIKEVQGYADMLSNDIEAFNKMVTDATEGASVDLDSITPLNIRVVLKYIRDLRAAAQEEEGEEAE